MRFVYLLNHITEALGIYTYASCNRIHKHKRILDVISISIAYIFLYYIYSFEIYNLNAISMLVVHTLLFLYIKREGLLSAIKDSLIIILIVLISELLVDVPLTLFRNDTAFSFDSLGAFITLSLIVRCLFFLLIFAVLQLRKKMICSFNTTNELIITVLLFISNLALISLGNLGFIVVLNEHQFPWIFGILISLFSLSIITIFLVNHLQRKQDELNNTKSTLRREQEEKHFNNLVKQHDEEQRILIHDFKNHLQTVYELLKTGSTDTASKHITELIASDQISSTPILANNKTLSILLARYTTLCNEKGISFSSDIKNVSFKEMTSSETTALFCNLLDNAIESAEKCSSPYIILQIHRNDHKNATVLVLTNSCISPPISDDSGNLQTHKKDQILHGIGIKSINRVIDLYNGFMHSYFKENDLTFHTIIVLYGRAGNENSNM